MTDGEDEVCPTCGGAGFVRREVPMDNPSFGKAEPCDCVLAEPEESRRERLTRLSNLDKLEQFTLSSLAGGTFNTVISNADLAVAREFAAEPEGSLVILGPSGSGKTALAAAIANDRVERGLPVLFMVAPDLLDHLRAGYTASDGDLSYDQLLAQVKESPLLALDDIDISARTDWAREKLFQILNHRQISGLATIYTATTDSGLGDRLASRLRGPNSTRLSLVKESSSYSQVGGMTKERLALLNFSNFELRGSGLQTEERESLVAAQAAAREFAERPRGFLTLLGVNGCGKTHLAAAAAGKAFANQLSVHFAVVPELLDRLRSSFAPERDSSADESWDQVREADLVVLDDLGSQVSSPWAQEKLFQIVNYRSVAGLATIVTSDCDREQLRSAHGRIASRIFDPRLGVTIAIIAPHHTLGRAAGTSGRRRGR